MYDDDHPDVFTDLVRGEWWRLDVDNVEFRRRLILGSPTDSWEGDDQLDLYYRDDPEMGRVWAIWRFAPELRMGRIKVCTIYGGPPGPELLRKLAAQRVDRFDFTKAREEFEERQEREALAAAAEAFEEMLAVAKFTAGRLGL